MESKVDVIISVYAKKLGFTTQKTYIKIKKIDETILAIYVVTITNFVI